MSKQKSGTTFTKSEIFSIISIGIALLTLIFTQYEFFKYAKPADKRSREAATEVVALSEPYIELAPLIADSPNIDSDADIENMKRVNLAIRVIPTTYQRSLSGQTNINPNIHYFFLILVNRGHGLAKSVSIDTFAWIPNENEEIPNGVNDIPQLGILDSREAFALLIDAGEDILAYDLPASLHANNVCISFSYTDNFGNSYDYPGPKCLLEWILNPLSPWMGP